MQSADIELTRETQTNYGLTPARSGDNAFWKTDTVAVAMEQGSVILHALQANSLFFRAVLPACYMSPLFNRYGAKGGENYGLHLDGSLQGVPGSPVWLRTDVSSTLFFSEPDEYDGGELVVVNTYGEHSTSLHRIEPVTRGGASARSSERKA